MRYICNFCGWIYDEKDGAEECGVPNNTLWSDVIEDFTCPLCGASKINFSPEE